MSPRMYLTFLLQHQGQLVWQNCRSVIIVRERAHIRWADNYCIFPLNFLYYEPSISTVCCSIYVLLMTWPCNFQQPMCKVLVASITAKYGWISNNENSWSLCLGVAKSVTNKCAGFWIVRSRLQVWLLVSLCFFIFKIQHPHCVSTQGWYRSRQSISTELCNAGGTCNWLASTHGESHFCPYTV